MIDYGLQLYSVRDVTKDDLKGTLEKVAALGYKYVEFAGFFGHPAADVKAWLAQYGLAVSGTHTGWQEVAEKYEETVAYHKAIGNVNIIIPGADLTTKEKLDAFIDMVNACQPRLAKEGITLHYHNHDREFFANNDGQVIYDELVNRTKMNLEIDTYWAYVGQKDPMKLMDELKGRVSVIHVKDGDIKGSGTPLGQGTAPVAAVRAKALENGVRMVVESETLKPDGLTEAKVCIAYLRSLE